MSKLFAFLLLFLPACAFASLEVSRVQKQQDQDYTITFCNLFKIENIALEKTSFGTFIKMPLELGGYKNLSVSSPELDLKIKTALEAKVLQKNTCGEVPLKLIYARKIKESSTLIAQLSFDDSLDIIIFISKYKKGKKDIYRVSYPQDFKFLNKNYKAKVRSFILANTKTLLDN